ncbi:MAG TPA: amidohydrolase family protein [Opitutaceae bacterium]|nr:amidohydrolase family protein [Opitutaceae bacterium]
MKRLPIACRTLLVAFLSLCAISSVAAATAKILVTGATILTVKPGAEEPFVGYIAIGDDGKIAAIGAGAPPAGLAAQQTVDGTGKIIIPGFISAHSHIWQSAFRGLAPNDWVRNWVTVTRSQSNQGSAEDFYWFTLHGCLDHVRHGITSAFNFTQGNRDPAYQENQLKAEIDSGLRVVHAFARSSSGLGAVPLPPDVVRKQFLDFLNFSKTYQDSPFLLKVGVAGSANTKESVAIDRSLVKEFGLVNQTHYLEFPLDTESQRSQFRFFVEADAVGPTLYFGHFIHTDDAMLETVGKAGGGMSWNPLSNGRLASGLPDIPRYLRFGVKIGMGVDGQASADIADPFENMRMGLYGIRAKYQSGTILRPIDVLRFHTLGSATVMNVADKVGSLEVGKYGDFLIIDPASVDRAPVYDPVATLVFACNTQNLEAVYIGGELVSSFCKLTKADFANVQRETHARVNKIRATTPVAPSAP